MVGVNNVAHDAICECVEGIMLEPCLLQPCFHVAGPPSTAARNFRPCSERPPRQEVTRLGPEAYHNYY